MQDIVKKMVAESGSPNDNHWTERPQVERERTTKEWAAAAPTPAATTPQPPSTRPGASSSSAPMDVGIEGTTPAEMAQARDDAWDLRRSLQYTYNLVLEKIGGSGLAFIKPQPDAPTAAPAAAAIPEEAPPDHLLQYDICTNSSGTRHDTLGEAMGWPGIAEKFHLDTDSLAHNGFEPEMQPHSGIKPLDWQSGGFHWWDPNSITPEGHYWKEVEVTHSALSIGQLYPGSTFKRAPDYHQILNSWFQN